jgi:hypothetical protein
MSETITYAVVDTDQNNRVVIHATTQAGALSAAQAYNAGWNRRRFLVMEAKREAPMARPGYAWGHPSAR